MILVLTKNSIEGYHKWSGAPEKVSFLRFPHRHIFEIYCQFEVTHEDREIEIVMQQEEIQNYLYEQYGEPCCFGEMSCESIARNILEKFNAYSVKVLEDGDGGALVTR